MIRIEDSLQKLIWKVPMPVIQEHTITIPEELIEYCPNLIQNGEISSLLRKQLIHTEICQKILNWAKLQLHKIRTAPGFVLLKVSDSTLSNDILKSLYYLISMGLGTLNNRYGELFEVKDRSLDHKKEAIPVSKTNASTGFHTDSTAKEYSPDIVGLLCLQPAKLGGKSILTNAANLYVWMQKYHPEDLLELTKPILRDVITPGSPTDIEAIKKNQFPVFAIAKDGFTFRYMNYWIISGHRRCNMDIPLRLQRALHRIEEYFQQEDNLIDYTMVRGDILFVNNNFICHNRTKYKDYEEADKKRTLVRTWIN